MDPPQINYINHNSIMVITHSGRIRQLFTPFRVQCILPVGSIKPLTWVYVEQVLPHRQELIIYPVFDQWYPNHCFINHLVNFKSLYPLKPCIRVAYTKTYKHKDVRFQDEDPDAGYT